MMIVKEKTKYHSFALVSEYDQKLVEYCRYLKATLGWQEFSFDSDHKRWRFNDLAVVLMLKNKFPSMAIEDTILQEVGTYVEDQKKEEKKEEKIKKIRESKVSNIQIKGIKGELYDYQKLGVEFFVNSGGRAILSDEMGVGKSLQALAYITFSGHKRTLVICPASVKFSWQNEVEKWTKLKSFVVNPKTKFSDIPHDTNVVIINYDVLQKHFNELMKYKWDCVILDEAHYIKSTTSIRSKATKHLSRNIDSVILLTGTPLLNRPIELFNLLNLVDPKTWNNWYSYAVRYAEGHQGEWGFESSGASNLVELKERISKYFLRRTKSEVLSQLPPKNRIDVPMELSKKFRDQYHMAATHLVNYLKKHKNKEDEEDTEDVNSVQAETLVRLNFLRQISSMAKLDVAKELIQNIIDNGEKVIVFSCFNQPLIDLKKYFEDESVILMGSTPVEERGDLVKKFQEDSNTKVFFGGMKSAGVGITLTAASNVINIDYSWVPGDHRQSEDRMHRVGQKAQSVNIYQIVSKNTIDTFMKKILDDKQEIFDQLIEGKMKKEMNSIIDEMLEDIKKTI